MMKTNIELEEALKIILESSKPLEDIEVVPVTKAEGRILAEDKLAPMSQPPFDRSPLDGYAMRSRDTLQASEENPVSLQVLETVSAGDFCPLTVREGQAVRIMTGASLPDGADCVIRQEEAAWDGQGKVYIGRPLAHHQNVCLAGEDVERGQLVLEKGTKLTYVEQAVLSSLGETQVGVLRKPRIGLVITGDELCVPGVPLTPGKIYDANMALCRGRLKELGYSPAFAVYAPDNLEQLAEVLCRMAEQTDCVITTGGVSVGEKDLFHQALLHMGADTLFWRVKMKPGTPAIFALYHSTPMLHLSGNPFAAITTLELLARPMIGRIAGDPLLTPRREKAVLANGFAKKSPGRRFLRARLEQGKVFVPPVSRHSSGMLTSMIHCNCLVDVPAGSDALMEGKEVTIVLL